MKFIIASKKITLFFLIISITKIFSIDNPHFYRASHFFGEPRLAKEWLTSLDFWVGTGKTRQGLNNKGIKTNVLNIYGNENIKELANGVPLTVLNKSTNNFLNNLWHKQTGEKFGTVRFKGQFSITEAVLDFYQNFKYGFFCEVYAPFRKLKISNITIDDLSTVQNASPDVNFNDWRVFINCLKKNLRNYDLNFGSITTTGFGDTTFLIGWTCNYEDTSYLDFIDGTFRTGILIPTGITRNPDEVFALPTGYNGHFAIPILFDISCGLYEWLTFGFYGSGLFFANINKCIRMKTAKEQNGFIKLTKGQANIRQGTIWNLGAFAKADHFIQGFSLYLGYRFDKQNDTIVVPQDLRTFTLEIVNSDKLLKSWNMHTINLMAEYDFATYYHPCLPKFQIFVDIPITGKQIFKTTMAGIYLAIDYAW